MSNEQQHFGEEVTVSVKRAEPKQPEPEKEPIVVQTRHKVMAWMLILGALASAGYGSYRLIADKPDEPVSHVEKMGLGESMQHQLVKKPASYFGGVLYYDIIRSQLNKKFTDTLNPFGRTYEQTHFGPIPNTIVTVGKTALRDCFGGTGTPTCTPVQAFKYHGIGTNSTAVTAADTGCGTELTTQYNPDNTRATGSQTNNGANIYRTIGTNTVDASVTIQELCLMSQAATGGGTMWAHVLTGAVALSSGDSLQTQYDLTIN